MAFIVPTMPIQANIWSNADWWATWPGAVNTPTFADVQCQLRSSLKFATRLDQPMSLTGVEEVVLPAFTDVRYPLPSTSEWLRFTDMMEVPKNSGRYYHVIGVVDVAKGFTNEYRLAIVQPTVGWEGTEFSGGKPNWPYAPAWPTPYP